MTGQPATASGAMEGGGAYNRHAKLPASGGALALPYLEEAAGNLPLDGSDRAIVIADYGSSQGRNSLYPMRVAIGVIRTRIGADRPILVYHEDLPANDFNALFEVLDKDPQSYALNASNVFPCAIGRSFYQSVLPPDHVDLGWCSYAAMWISRIPTLIPGHFFVFRSTGEVRRAFDEQGARDWENFLTLRAKELRPGGRLVVVVPAANDAGISGFEEIMDQANATLAEMVDEGAIAAEERARMVIGGWPKRTSDLLAPFARDDAFRGLRVVKCQIGALADAAWVDYERDRGKEALATKHALFFRTIFAPTLAQSLANAGDVHRVQAFYERLQSGLTQRLAREPRPIDSLVATVVFAKS